MNGNPRLSRLRANAGLRRLRQETTLEAARLWLPLFVTDAPELTGEIPSLPGVRRWRVDELPALAHRLVRAGLGGVLVFGVPRQKDPSGNSANGADGVDGAGLVEGAIRHLKQGAPELVVATDICLCPYTDHGHCGVLTPQGELDETATLPRLTAMALAHARAGADLVAPSSSLDGQVAAIRAGLDAGGWEATPILAYSAKFASAFYGPFREAARSAPRHGDRRAQQLDPANGREALAVIERDLAAGADVVMVKPAGPYLDVVARARERFPHAVIAAYQVSGEYAQLQAAAAAGWLDERSATTESLLGLRRAGADWLITYAAERVARWLAPVAPAAREDTP